MISLTATTYNDRDLVSSFLTYHLEQGVDCIVVIDMDSVDGTQELLREYDRDNQVVLLKVDPEQNRKLNNRRNVMAAFCIEELDATWILHSDPDEFWRASDLTIANTLPAAFPATVDALSCSRYNLVAESSAHKGLRSPFDIQNFCHSVRAPFVPTPTEMASGNLRRPWIFSQGANKIITRGDRRLSIGNGAHSVVGKAITAVTDHLHILHLPMPSYAHFENKVRGIRGFVDANHLGGSDAWHWRRWLGIYDAGLLEEEYLANRLTPDLDDEFRNSLRLRPEHSFLADVTAANQGSITE